MSDYLYNHIIWHNLPKIQNMYKNILDVVFPNDISSIHKAITIRHDIVHRNGRKKSGGYHKFDEKTLAHLMTDVNNLVSKINEQLSEIKTEQRHTL